MIRRENFTIDDKIADVKSKIRLCKYDLEGIFKGNPVIERKMQLLGERLAELEAQKAAGNSKE